MEGLQEFSEFINKLRSTNSTTQKKLILATYEDDVEITTLFKIVMNPFVMFNVTAKSIEKFAEKNPAIDRYELEFPSNTVELCNFLMDLSERKISGSEALSHCIVTIGSYAEYSDLLLDIFNKDLKISFGVKSVNQVIPKLIPTFDVCLAEKATDKLLTLVNEQPDFWTIQRKLDGVRCVIIYDHEGKTTKVIEKPPREDSDEYIETVRHIMSPTIKAKSRKGLDFVSLEKVINAVSKLFEGSEVSWVLDGEICVVDEEGNEDFSAAVSQVKRKSVTMERPKYKIFDLIPLEDFEKGISEQPYGVRWSAIRRIAAERPSEFYDVVDSIPYSEENFLIMQNKVSELDWEGLMLRKNVPYEGKQTKNLLKVKKFFTEEYKVVSIEYGLFPELQDGTMVQIKAMASVAIMHKGNIVSVGSGFSLAQRKEFHANPEKIIGKTISVQYFEESKNKNNDSISLRFPTFKHLWGAERDV